jgi:hypothetical protein
VSRGVPLAHEQARDEEPAQDEEEVDAEEASWRDVGREVVEDDRQDGEPAEPVERAEVGEAGGRLGSGRVRRPVAARLVDASRWRRQRVDPP